MYFGQVCSKIHLTFIHIYPQFTWGHLYFISSCSARCRRVTRCRVTRYSNIHPHCKHLYFYLSIYLIYIVPLHRLFISYQRHFTIFTCARPFSVSFLCEKEPPPPRSTPRCHGSFIHISASVQQPGETHDVSAFALLHLLHNQVEVWWLGVFQWSTHVLLCAPIT